MIQTYASLASDSIHENLIDLNNVFGIFDYKRVLHGYIHYEIDVPWCCAIRLLDLTYVSRRG